MLLTIVCLLTDDCITKTLSERQHRSLDFQKVTVYGIYKYIYIYIYIYKRLNEMSKK